MKEKYITIKDSQMSYLDLGQGPVLVFGHSYLWDSQMWLPQLEVLAQHYRCIVPDFWAHGRSGFLPATTASLADYADDILFLLDQLQIDKFAMIGLSLGGMWGTELALKVPQRVVGLVLMDTFVGLEPEVANAKYQQMFAVIQQAKAIPYHLIEQIVPLFFAPNTMVIQPELAQQLQHRLSLVKDAHADQIVAIGQLLFGRRDLFDELTRLTMPCLIVVGADDKPRPPLESQLMHDALAHSQYIIVPNAGHISNLEQPAAVTSHLTQFLSALF